jgi:hypothetical protein
MYRAFDEFSVEKKLSLGGSPAIPGIEIYGGRLWAPHRMARNRWLPYGNINSRVKGSIYVNLGDQYPGGFDINSVDPIEMICMGLLDLDKGDMKWDEVLRKTGTRTQAYVFENLMNRDLDRLELKRGSFGIILSWDRVGTVPVPKPSPKQINSRYLGGIQRGKSVEWKEVCKEEFEKNMNYKT